MDRAHTVSECIAVLVSFAVYFLPTVAVLWRNPQRAYLVFVINVLTGWTLIGWGFALATALIPRPRGTLGDETGTEVIMASPYPFGEHTDPVGYPPGWG